MPRMAGVKRKRLIPKILPFTYHVLRLTLKYLPNYHNYAEKCGLN